MKYLKIIIGLFFLISCKVANSTRPNNYIVTRYEKIEHGYQYSNNVIVYYSNNYQPITSAIYINDSLTAFDLYKAEGAVGYSITDIKADTQFFKMLNIPLIRSIKINKKEIVDNEKVYKITEIRRDSIYSLQNDTLLLYCLD